MSPMEDNGQDQNVVKPSWWHVTMLILCVYVLASLLVDTIFHLDKENRDLILTIDNFICLIFIADFFHSLFTAKSKLRYLKWGWIDLLSSIPNIPWLWVGRLSRVVRILRIFRGIRSVKILFTFIYLRRAENAIAAVVLITIITVSFSSIAILNVEDDPKSNINTAEDALWWSISTITSVGYGDKYPVTTEGRTVAAALMVTGVGLFGAFTAYVASLFVNKGNERKAEVLELKTELNDIKDKLDKLLNK